MAEELELCPFCGGEASLMKHSGPCWVECEACGAVGPNDAATSTEQNEAAWNTRQLAPPTDAQVEAAAVAVARVDAPPFTAGSNDGRNMMRHYKRLARAALETAGRA